jgi:hypothetical protein
MVLNATFNNISGILRGSVLLVEKTEFSVKTTDLSQVIDKHKHNVVSNIPHHERDSNSQR